MTTPTTAPQVADTNGAPAPGPLSGVLVVALTQAWAGTFATQLLSQLGADVIQIEARQRPDVWRGGYNARIPSALLSQTRAEHGWNVSPLYNSVNLGKRGVTLDLSHERGKSLFASLVSQADVVAENFSPRVMGNLGLSYEALQRIKPDIIMLSLSAYGAYGPYSNYPGIGGTIEAMSGMTSLLGYAGADPVNSGLMYPDPVAGYYGAAAVTLALLHRKRTGKGQHLRLAMQEACATFVADAFVAYGTTGEVPPRAGNHHPVIAPHNIYPSSEEEGWIAIAATSEDEFSALCRVLSIDGLVGTPAFSSNSARKANEDALDEQIGAATSKFTTDQLHRTLVAAGVPSRPVVRPEAVFQDSLLHERGTFAPVEHAEAGLHMHPVGPWKFGDTPRRLTLSAPCIGQHSREVLTQMCGISDAEYERLVALGVTGEGPPA